MVQKIRTEEKNYEILIFVCFNFNLLNGITHSIIERRIFTFIFTLKYRK